MKVKHKFTYNHLEEEYNEDKVSPVNSVSISNDEHRVVVARSNDSVTV